MWEDADEQKKTSVLVCIVSQDNLNNKGFGQDLPSVENEVEEHNIFHSEVEALAPHITAGGDKVRVKILKTEQRSCLSIKVSTMVQ